MSDAVVREWQKIEFLTPGEIAKHPEPIHEEKVSFVVTPGQQPQRLVDKVLVGWKPKEYHPQGSLGHGYYIVEDGKVVGHTDEQGNELDMSRVHECRIVKGAVFTECPYTQSP